MLTAFLGVPVALTLPFAITEMSPFSDVRLMAGLSPPLWATPPLPIVRLSAPFAVVARMPEPPLPLT
ncbi:MAG: hypothetical protein ACLQE9_06900, partial [Roseiarcus sp.]